MARYTATEAAGLLFEEGIIDSGDESEIEEDPRFPLPHAEDEEEHDSQPLPLLSHFSLPHTADGCAQDEEELDSQSFPLTSHFTPLHIADGDAQDELHSQPFPVLPLLHSSSVDDLHNQPLPLAHVATTSNSGIIILLLYSKYKQKIYYKYQEHTMTRSSFFARLGINKHNYWQATSERCR